MSKRFLKNPQTFTQDLSAAALSFTTSFPNKPFRVLWISLKATQAISETVTITIDSKTGATYDFQGNTVDLVSERSFFYKPHGDLELLAGDQIKVECTDANGVGSVSGEVRGAEIKQ